MLLASAAGLTEILGMFPSQGLEQRHDTLSLCVSGPDTALEIWSLSEEQGKYSMAAETMVQLLTRCMVQSEIILSATLTSDVPLYKFAALVGFSSLFCL